MSRQLARPAAPRTTPATSLSATAASTAWTFRSAIARSSRRCTGARGDGIVLMRFSRARVAARRSMRSSPICSGEDSQLPHLQVAPGHGAATDTAAGIVVNEIYEAWAARGIGPRDLAARLGWPEAAINNRRLRGQGDALLFPTIEEVRAALRDIRGNVRSSARVRPGGALSHVRPEAPLADRRRDALRRSRHPLSPMQQGIRRVLARARIRVVRPAAGLFAERRSSTRLSARGLGPDDRAPRRSFARPWNSRPTACFSRCTRAYRFPGRKGTGPRSPPDVAKCCRNF